MSSASSSVSSTDNDSSSEAHDLSPLHKELLAKLGDLLKTRPSFSHGTMQLPLQAFTLFYGNGQDVRRINLSSATDTELAHLSDVCAAATFGRNQQDVLDESYRKARKLDCSEFACHFDAERSGLVKVACGELLVGEDSTRPIRAELYKLNVYGPGSFFKPHQDTPRGTTMFGSLVVVFPTSHEGGELVLCPKDAEENTVLDFVAWMGKADGPSIAYAAFFSDVSHEVYEVKHGYRVSLTYNLYYDDPSKDVSATEKTPLVIESNIPETSIAASLTEILSEPNFLPNGGLLGFGLRYQYPIDSDEYFKKQNIISRLKGADSTISRLLSQQGLKPFLMAVYEAGDTSIMCDHFVDYVGDLGDEDNLCDILLRDHRGIVIDSWADAYPREPAIEEPVTWITDPTFLNTDSKDYTTFGNEPLSVCAYADLVLMVRVGAPSERAHVPKIKRTKRVYDGYLRGYQKISYYSSDSE